MKPLLILLFLCAPVLAEGPIYKSKDRFTQLEFDNAYQDLRGKQAAIPLLTKAQLSANSPRASNLLFICTDCTTDGLVISTGTTMGAVGRISSKTTAIN